MEHISIILGIAGLVITIIINFVVVAFKTGQITKELENLKTDISTNLKNDLIQKHDETVKKIERLEDNDIQHIYNFISEIKHSMNSISTDIAVIKAKCRFCDDDPKVKVEKY
jgi:uncharacterized membrane-anchored protein YhcB (DUF1043 family)